MKQYYAHTKTNELTEIPEDLLAQIVAGDAIVFVGNGVL